MPKPRIDLQDLFESILGSPFVYFQPPTTTRMKYPCIRYELSGTNTRSADGESTYIYNRQYTVTYISTYPESEVFDKLLKLPYCSFNRRYVSDNLYHDVFTIYY